MSDIVINDTTHEDVESIVVKNTSGGGTKYTKGERPAGTINITSNGTHDVTNYASANVDVQASTQEKTVDPSTTEVSVTPDSGKLLSKVTVNAVTNSIDPNITPTNIRAGVTVLGVEGNLEPDKPNQTKSVAPTTSQQVVTADTGYELESVTIEAVNPADYHKPEETINIQPTTSEQVVTPTNGSVFSSVTVGAVTSAIDANITAENIRKDVTILGVTGTLEEGKDYDVESILNDDGTQTLNITHKDYVPSFKDASPQYIAKASEKIAQGGLTSAQVAEQYGWNLGDSIPITLSTGEVIEMQIIGVNHDDLSDGTGKAGLTLQMKNCLATRYPMNSSNTNAGGYAASKMKTQTLPTLKALLPQEWQDVIKLVDKKSANGGSTNYSETLTTSDGLFLLAEIEVFGATTYAQDGTNEGSVYEYWNGKADADRVKKYDKDADGVPEAATIWWLRSSYYVNTGYFCFVTASGGANNTSANNSRGVAFAFCI